MRVCGDGGCADFQVSSVRTYTACEVHGYDLLLAAATLAEVHDDRRVNLMFQALEVDGHIIIHLN